MADNLLRLVGTEENERTFQGPKVSYTFRRDGGTGFWTVHPSAGSTPSDVAGSYTSLDFAKSDLERYLRDQKEEEERPRRPEKVKLSPRIPKESKTEQE